MSLSPSGQATLLLTLWLPGGSKAAPSPLSPSEWHGLASRLHERGQRPADLLSPNAEALMDDLGTPKTPVARLRGLLGRGTALALALERWERAGLWVVTRGESGYPTRLRQRLKSKAPPFLVGAGSLGLMERGGRAIVGSRDATDAQLQAARDLGRMAAAEGTPVISGGARGVDEAALRGCLESGGEAIAVLPGDLLRAATSARYRQALMEGRLALLATAHPEAPFSTGSAMGRNKIIYGLADSAVVVSVHSERGGTRAGALENLKAGWVPLYLTPDAGSAEATQALFALGAQRMPAAQSSAPPTPAAATPGVVREPSALPTQPKEPDAETAATSLYEHFLADLRRLTQSGALGPDEIGKELQLERSQVKAWLERALDEGRVVKRTRPVRYSWSSKGPAPRQTGLFDA